MCAFCTHTLSLHSLYSMNILWLLIMDGVTGFLRQESARNSVTVETYSCTPQNGTYNDMAVDIFTSKRMPTTPWPSISVEIPKSYSEFMCGIQHRNLTADCMCGYLFPWRTPQIVTLYFRAVSFDSEVFFFDSFKKVLSYQSVPALSQKPIVSVSNTQYVLVTQSGIASRLGVEIGDPANFTLPSNAYVGESTSNYDDRVGMHD